MNQQLGQDRLVWSFWAAAGIAFVGGLLPLVVGGASSRVATVAIPYTIAAAAFAACAFVNRQGRAISAILYFVAGLALVYGMLAMFSVPLQLAVLGSCAAPPAPCSGGLGRPLTIAENTGMGFATALGVIALFVGFFGLMVVFRNRATTTPAPRVRTIPPVKTPEAAGPEAPRPEPAIEADVKVAVAPRPMKPEPEPALEELPAPEELPELPPHESSAGTT